ncbi:SDR family oxidoreductase [Candidatus Frankia alpina]|uniref:SDR family oxidoreductase n=1 Tax=Candidatus Frankia alpina TaxID=2699483 RepID=A0A4S5E0I8_9ACTN|nr:SDR family NAD(P)-dependent oxidoreductase [Candidatus Frankia alpina]THJ64835.1 SDR family oxidoreductase [Candidatus Frankia alpina]
MPYRALVTGAGRDGGIGQAIVKRLEADGMEVLTLDKLPGCTWQVDLATDELPDFGPVDVYVANAAITTLFGAAHTFSLEKWRLDLDINLTGTFRVLQKCLTGMRERRYGRIVVISSTSGTRGMPAQVSYATSKAGLIGMTKTVAAENVGAGVTANCVLPGMTASSGILGMPESIKDAWLDSLPSGFVDPADIANAVAFFASPESGMVTGQLLTVDGGDGLNTRSVTSSVSRRRQA